MEKLVVVPLSAVLLYFILSCILLSFQYGYITELKELAKRKKRKGISQHEMYDKMSFEEQELNYTVQSSFFFIGANILATLLYNWNQREERIKNKQELKKQEDKIINELKTGTIDSFYDYLYQDNAFKKGSHIVSESVVRESVYKFLVNH